MKIFSNFDTKIRSKAISEHVVKYGEENVLCFGRSKLYWYVKVLFPMIYLISAFSIFTYIFYVAFDGDYIWYFVLSAFVLSLFFLMPIIGKRIDYRLDFIIVTPDFLMMYDQSGVLKKKVVTVHEKSIKTISVERSGFLYSLFNNGDIIVLSEGDVSHGEITLRWIPKPEKRRIQIAKILNKSV